MCAEREGDGVWTARPQPETRVAGDSPRTLTASAQCSEPFCYENLPSPAFDVTILFKTTTPAAGPATPIS